MSVLQPLYFYHRLFIREFKDSESLNILMTFLRGCLLCAVLFYFAIGLLIYFDNNFLAGRRCIGIFPSSVLYLFLIYVSLLRKSLKFHLIITAFTDRNFGMTPSPALLNTKPMCSSVSSRVFMVSALTCRSSVHFKYRIR